VRHAYRDSSLRAYDLDAFSLERARRGPVFFFGFERDRVIELSAAELRRTAVSTFRRDRTPAAYQVVVYAAESAPDDWLSRYWLAWVEWSRGDTTAAIGHLRRLGLRALAGAPFTWQSSWSQRTLAAGDSAGAIDLLGRVVRRRALDPEPHLRLAALMRRSGDADRAEAEAYAAQVLRQRPTARAAAMRRAPDATAANLP